MKRLLVALAAGATFATGLALMQQREPADAAPPASPEPPSPASATPPGIQLAEGAPDPLAERATDTPAVDLAPADEPPGELSTLEPFGSPGTPAALSPQADPAPAAAAPRQLPTIEVVTPPPVPPALAAPAAPALPTPSPEAVQAGTPGPGVAAATAAAAAPGAPVTVVQVFVQPAGSGAATQPVYEAAVTSGGALRTAPSAPATTLPGATAGTTARYGAAPPPIGAVPDPQSEAVRRGAGLITQGDYVARPPLAQPFGPGVVTQAFGAGTVAQPFAPAAAAQWAAGLAPWMLDPNAAAIPFESPEEGVQVPPGPLTAAGPLFPHGTPAGPLTADGSLYAPRPAAARDEVPTVWPGIPVLPTTPPAAAPPVPPAAPAQDAWALGDCGWLDAEGVPSRFARVSVTGGGDLPLDGACFEIVGSVRSADHWSLQLAGPVTYDLADRDRSPPFIFQVDLPLADLRGGASLDVVADPSSPDGFLPARGQAKVFLDDNRDEADLARLGAEANYAAVGGDVRVHRFERRAPARAQADEVTLVASLDLRMRRLDRTLLPPVPMGPVVTVRGQLRVYETPPLAGETPAVLGPLDDSEAAPLEK